MTGNVRRSSLAGVAFAVAVALVVKTIVAVVAGYGAYFPPDFSAGFLVGREHYFFGPYRLAFVTHVLASPVALLLGTLLVCERFRLVCPRWHRRAGRVQVPLVICCVAPSGLWMAAYAAAGPVAGIALAMLAVGTAFTAVAGWRAAVAGRFAAHRRWMWRNYLLLCSAVLIRVLAGAGTVLGVTAAWFDTAATWVSWVGPLVVFEIALRLRRDDAQNSPGSAPIVSSASRDSVAMF